MGLSSATDPMGQGRTGGKKKASGRTRGSSHARGRQSPDTGRDAGSSGSHGRAAMDVSASAAAAAAAAAPGRRGADAAGAAAAAARRKKRSAEEIRREKEAAALSARRSAMAMPASSHPMDLRRERPTDFSVKPAMNRALLRKYAFKALDNFRKLVSDRGKYVTPATRGTALDHAAYKVNAIFGPFAAMNCVAVAILKDGRAVISSNSPLPPHARGQLDSLFPTGWVLLNPKDSVTADLHAEIKLWERICNFEVSQFGIQQPCCLFCAAQLLAAGIDTFTGSHGDVYNFTSISRTLLRFPDATRRLLGEEVFAWYSKLSPDEQAQFITALEGAGLDYRRVRDIKKRHGAKEDLGKKDRERGAAYEEEHRYDFEPDEDYVDDPNGDEDSGSDEKSEDPDDDEDHDDEEDGTLLRDDDDHPAEVWYDDEGFDILHQDDDGHCFYRSAAEYLQQHGRNVGDHNALRARLSREVMAGEQRNRIAAANRDMRDNYATLEDMQLLAINARIPMTIHLCPMEDGGDGPVTQVDYGPEGDDRLHLLFTYNPEDGSGHVQPMVRQ